MNNLVGIASRCLTVALPMATVRSATEPSTGVVDTDISVRPGKYRNRNVAFFSTLWFFAALCVLTYIKVAPLTAFSI